MNLESSGESRFGNEEAAAQEPVPEWHQQVLDNRLDDYRNGKVKSISLEELERRLAKS